jgi:hypothetical protein
MKQVVQMEESFQHLVGDPWIVQFIILFSRGDPLYRFFQGSISSSAAA